MCGGPDIVVATPILKHRGSMVHWYPNFWAVTSISLLISTWSIASKNWAQLWHDQVGLVFTMGMTSIPGVSKLLGIRGRPQFCCWSQACSKRKVGHMDSMGSGFTVILSWRIWDVRRSLWDLVRSFWTVHIHHIFHHMLSYFIYSRMDYTSRFTHTAVPARDHRADPGLHIAARNAKHRGKNSWLWVSDGSETLGFYPEWILYTSSYPFLTTKNLMFGVSIPFFWCFFYHVYLHFLPTKMDGFWETQMGWRLGICAKLQISLVEQKRDYKTKHMGM